MNCSNEKVLFVSLKFKLIYQLLFIRVFELNAGFSNRKSQNQDQLKIGKMFLRGGGEYSVICILLTFGQLQQKK